MHVCSKQAAICILCIYYVTQMHVPVFHASIHSAEQMCSFRFTEDHGVHSASTLYRIDRYRLTYCMHAVAEQDHLALRIAVC